MIIEGLGDEFIDDWFGLGRNAKSVWNGRAVEGSSVSGHWNNAVLAMIKEPSEASLKGAYSQERGFSAEGTITWKNDPAPRPSPRDRDNSYERERPNNERESSSRERSSKESKTRDE